MTSLGVTAGAMMDVGNIPYWLLLVAFVVIVSYIVEDRT